MDFCETTSKTLEISWVGVRHVAFGAAALQLREAVLERLLGNLLQREYLY